MSTGLMVTALVSVRIGGPSDLLVIVLVLVLVLVVLLVLLLVFVSCVAARKIARRQSAWDRSTIA